MATNIRFDPIRLPAETETLRGEVRAFLAEEIAANLLSRFPMPDIFVKIRKPSALAHLDVTGAGVEIHRRALDTEA